MILNYPTFSMTLLKCSVQDHLQKNVNVRHETCMHCKMINIGRQFKLPYLAETYKLSNWMAANTYYITLIGFIQIDRQLSQIKKKNSKYFLSSKSYKLNSSQYLILCIILSTNCDVTAYCVHSYSLRLILRLFSRLVDS